jgi:hypothetical protein
MPEATACPPAVVADTIMRTIKLGVTITDAAVDEKTTTVFYVPVARDPRCPGCGREGRYRDTVTRPLTDLPVAGYPLGRCDARVRTYGVQSGSGKAGGSASGDHSAVRPVCVAAVDDRPHNYLGHRREKACRRIS